MRSRVEQFAAIRGDHRVEGSRFERWPTGKVCIGAGPALVLTPVVGVFHREYLQVVAARVSSDKDRLPCARALVRYETR